MAVYGAAGGLGEWSGGPSDEKPAKMPLEERRPVPKGTGLGFSSDSPRLACPVQLGKGADLRREGRSEQQFA